MNDYDDDDEYEYEYQKKLKFFSDIEEAENFFNKGKIGE